MTHLQDAPFQNITIIGLGLIGGSLAMAIRERFPTVFLRTIDTAAEALQYALKANLADDVSRTLPAHFEDNHLIILACHLNDSLDYLERLSRLIQPGQDIVVSDVGSCKRKIDALAMTILPHQFIGGHPLAGKERSGIQYASSLLFAGKPYLLCPLPDTPRNHLTRLEQFVSILGAEPRRIDPAQHDQVLAYTSHFPQLYALLLSKLVADNKPGLLLSYSGGGLDDQLRLTGSSPTMWREIFEHNQDNLKTVVKQFSELLANSSEQLHRQAPPNFSQAFETAGRIYQDWQSSRLNPVL